jgi:hypothetical protein
LEFLSARTQVELDSVKWSSTLRCGMPLPSLDITLHALLNLLITYINTLLIQFSSLVAIT